MERLISERRNREVEIATAEGSRMTEIAALPVVEKAPGQPGTADVNEASAADLADMRTRCWRGGGREALIQP